MKAEHLEILLEEPSMEAFLQQLLPKLLNKETTFAFHVHQGKKDLLRKLESRLRGYAHWLPAHMRIVVLVDRDSQNCTDIKKALEQATRTSGLSSRSRAGSTSWQVVNRIAIEELEAWFFGEWSAVISAYPKVSQTVPQKAAFRDCDEINNTWEAFERVLQEAGYFRGGMRKVEAARAIGAAFKPARCRSPSFKALQLAITEAAS